MKVLSAWSWAASSLLAPGQAIISSDTKGRADPTPPLSGQGGGIEGMRCWPSLSGPASSLITGCRPPCLQNKEPWSRACRWACIHSLRPLFPSNMKKGLIVFNNMLSNTPHPITTLPSLIRIRITSGAMFCPSLLLNLITTRSRGRDRAGFLNTLFSFFLPLAHLICLAAPSLLRLH